ncbi:MAG: murein biosynthesis integral membrane protein MurJ [Syntrophorhabdaceae bacterium]|nr:murein biosynthesis integral membrane protein MurJ [Syntrophorhabdaceae bacterium]
MADIIKKGSVITLITLISRPLGYIREAVQAYLFGATILVDAFVVAFNFPELIQTLFFSGATSAFLIPVCTKYIKDNDEFSQIYSIFINIALIVTLSVSVFLFLFSDFIINIIAPGFTGDVKKVTNKLFLIMIPVITLHAVLSVMKAFLNAKEHFAAPELSGIIWNITFILSGIFLNNKFGIYSLAIGVSVGSIFQLMLQYPYLRTYNIRYNINFNLKHPALSDVKRLFAGAFIATSIVPINSFIGRMIGSYLPHGEVASLAYAFRIFILPFSLFAVPVYTVIFSKISKLYHDQDLKGIFSHIDSTIVLLSITMIPSTIIVCTNGETIIRILYERGAFGIDETVMTNRALFGYGLGLVFYALSLSFVRIFNGLHDTKTPALVGLSTIFINAFLSYLLMQRLNNFGIAVSTSLCSLYNFSMLYIMLKKKIKYTLSAKAMREITKSVIIGVITVLIIFIINKITYGHMYIGFVINMAAVIIVFSICFKEYYIALIKRFAR